MRVLRTVAELREQLATAHRDGRRIGLVPTMGALHDGHLSLIRGARERCDVVVVTLFVNPAQFNESSDLERYPRDEKHDQQLAAAAGADILFAPDVDEVYPRGFSTSVEVLGVSERLEGEHRGAEHFRGVATVVAKLLCMALPDEAYFGDKDAQQLVVIRRLVADLNLPVEVVGMPTVREHDGLAMSSRNALLGTEERERATALWRALDAARAVAAAGEQEADALVAAATDVLADAGVAPEYVALVDPDTFEPLPALERPGLLAIAAHVGAVRLIDNTLLEPASVPASGRADAGKEHAPCSA
jgi:pantoate--beta-alanine ligase